LFKLFDAQHKCRKALSDRYQREFDKFCTILNKYLTPQAMRELEGPLNLREINSTWDLITQKIKNGNGLTVVSIVDRYAFIYDWGILETLLQCLIRHEILWQHMVNLGDIVSDIRKKTFLIGMVEAATGSHGPYILELASASKAAINYADAKEMFLQQEPNVVARSNSNNNKVGANSAKQMFSDLWQPYDGKKKKVSGDTTWVYDEQVAKSYMDPHTLSASTAMATAHAASIASETKKGNGTKNNNNAKPRTPCPICGGNHFIRECKQAELCKNNTCKKWYHR
jgi:hypothetical protein